jgi:S-disulfanyl-L-cysteine oxidoreductase SoxD
MSRGRTAALAFAWAFLISGAAGTRANDRPYGIGREVPRSELAQSDLTVFPDGAGLPKGSGSVREGRDVYALRCAGCHGPKGEGDDNHPALAGGRGSLRSSRPELTVGSYWPHATTLWDYTRRAMPYPQPGSLSVGEVYAVTAYVLYLNAIVSESTVLDERSLPKIDMPNKNGFVRDPRPDFTPTRP